MGFVDPGVRRVDDNEHLGGEIGALAVEEHAGNLDPVRLVGMLLAKEMKRREPVLSVDDQVMAVRFTEKTDALRGVRAAKAQRFIRKQQNRAGNQRLVDRGLVEVDDLANLPAVEQALERLFALFDAGDELRDLVVAGFIRFDLFALEVVAAAEAHMVQEIDRFESDEIENALFLGDSRGKHRPSLVRASIMPLGGFLQVKNIYYIARR